MNIEYIDEIEIDKDGKLHLKVRKNHYDMIYREAVGVYYNRKKRTLHSTTPTNWSYLEWFNHIVKTFNNFDNSKLVLADKVSFVNVPKSIKDSIEQQYQK